ncbi:MAG: extracellular solute-binding protein [Chloroflexota bacterium]
MNSTSLSRRHFLQLAAGTSALALAACVAPAAAPSTDGDGGGDMAPGEVHLLKWASFIAPADEDMFAEAETWGAENNVEVQIETINQNDIAARLASAIQSQDGPDAIQSNDNWGYLFEENLLDVGDVVSDIEAAVGGTFFDDQVAFSKVGDTWRTVPWTIIGNSHVYRKDMFEEVLGRSEWGIDTWEDYTATATAMKEAGMPFGNSIGHSFGDPVSFWYPYLWCHGGSEVNEDATEVTLASDETVSAINSAIELVNNGFADGVVAWDDGSNNRSYLASEISCTLNGASIYFVAKRDVQDVFEVSSHGLHPSGPAGRYSYMGGRSHGILSYSENVDATKAFLVHMAKPEFYEGWLLTSEAYNVGPISGYNDEDVWSADENVLPFREAVNGGTSRWPGFPGPANAAAFASRNDYLVVDIFAKAVTGEMSAEEAAEWGAAEVAKRYGL